MNKNLLLLILCFSIFQIQAQRVLTIEEGLKLGNVSTIGFVKETNKDIDDIYLNTGYNHVWDYSGENWNSQMVNYKFRYSYLSDVTAMHYTWMNEICETPIPRNFFYTYNAARDTVFLDAYKDGIHLMKYPQRVPYLTYPMNFGDTIYQYTPQKQNSTNPFLPIGSVYSIAMYDGFGTLKTPTHTFDSVFRITRVQLDSIYLGPILLSNLGFAEIFWVQANVGLPLLRIVEQENGYLVYYSDTLGNTLGIDKNDLNRNVEVYPNPFKEEIQVEISGYQISKLSMSDMNGKLILEQIGSQSNIETSHLPEGMYLLEIEITSGERVYRKVVK
jgi:hypothetical protein